MASFAIPTPAAIRIHVLGAEIRSSLPDGKKQFTAYRIEVAHLNEKWSVFRRYSEFDSLHDSLRKSIKPHPSFPGKKTLGNKKPEFIEQRRIKLEQYLQDILASPNVSSLEGPYRELLEFLEFYPPTVSYLLAGLSSSYLSSPPESPSTAATNHSGSNGSAASTPSSPIPSPQPNRSSKFPWKRRKSSQSSVLNYEVSSINTAVSSSIQETESEIDDKDKPLFVTVNIYGDLKDFGPRIDEDEEDGTSLKELDNAAEALAKGGVVKPRGVSKTEVGSFILVEHSDFLDDAGKISAAAKRSDSIRAAFQLSKFDRESQVFVFEDNVLAGVQACLFEAIDFLECLSIVPAEATEHETPSLHLSASLLSSSPSRQTAQAETVAPAASGDNAVISCSREDVLPAPQFASALALQTDEAPSSTSALEDGRTIHVVVEEAASVPDLDESIAGLARTPPLLMLAQPPSPSPSPSPALPELCESVIHLDIDAAAEGEENEGLRKAPYHLPIQSNPSTFLLRHENGEAIC